MTEHRSRPGDMTPASCTSPTAADILAARARRAAAFYPHDPTARKAFLRHCERARVLAVHADVYVHAYWRALDSGRIAQPVGLDAPHDSRAEQEKVVAEWAWAHANTDNRFTSPGLAADMDIMLITSTNIDPSSIRATAPTITYPPHANTMGCT
ncbi:hypothetical protein [Nocardia wallacei]|uniref:hypothetical protein n=1 Tax=Nocardia wallacei TaxID=480035 RepID=UPI00245650D7|nr:hypothetical protein [Nocardia wallacei]